MNNIELRLITEQNRREEDMLRCMKNIHVKKQPTQKSVWKILNSLPVLMGIELFYHKQIIKN